MNVLVNRVKTAIRPGLSEAAVAADALDERSPGVQPCAGVCSAVELSTASAVRARERRVGVRAACT